MKKAILLVFSVIFTLLFSACKKEAELKLVSNSFGAVIGDGKNRQIAEVLQTADEGFLICGTESVGKNGYSDGYVMKTDKSFNLLWYKSFGGVNQDRFESMAMDEEGNIMLAGTTYSFGPSLDSTRDDRNSLFYVILTDKNGNKIWEKSYLPPNPPSSKNYINLAHKVLYTKDKQFCVAGQSGNVLNDPRSTVGIVLGIDESGQINWSRKYNKITITAGVSHFESIDDMEIAEDGNLMLLAARLDTFWQPYLLKIPVAASDHSSNSFISSSPLLPASADDGFDKSQQFSFAISKDNTAVIGVLSGGYSLQGSVVDPPSAQILVSDEKGTKTYTKLYKKYIWDMNLDRRGDRLIISGEHRSATGNFPCWVVTDLDGNALSEVFLELPAIYSEKIKIKSMFLNAKNEMLAFGNWNSDEGSQIIILKYDQKGNIIKL